MLLDNHIRSLTVAALALSVSFIPNAAGAAFARSNNLTKRGGEEYFHIVSNSPDKASCRRYFSNEYLREQNADKSKTVEKKVADTLKEISNKCMYSKIDQSDAVAAVRDPKHKGHYNTYKDFDKRWRDFFWSDPERPELSGYYFPGYKTNVPYFEMICNESGGSPLQSDVVGLRSQESDTCAASHLHRLGKVNPGDCKMMRKKGTAQSNICAPSTILHEKYRKGSDELYTEAFEAVKDIVDGSSCWFRERVLPQLIAEKCSKVKGKAGGIVRIGAVINEGKFACRLKLASSGSFDCGGTVNSNWKVVWVGDITISHTGEK